MISAKKFAVQRVLFTLAFPVAAMAVMHIFTRGVVGVNLFANIIDVKNLLRMFIIAFACTMALAFNLPAGRFDMSLGAQIYVSVIIGGNLALLLGSSSVIVLSGIALAGTIFGFLVGLVFVWLRILPMVYGLGVALILECISFAFFNAKGLVLFGVPAATTLSNIPAIAVATGITIIVMSFILDHTRFGYEKKAVQGNQSIASDSGINIFKNAVICYTLAGLMAGVSGTFDVAYSGALAPVLNLGTIAIIGSNLFPFVLGAHIGQWSNQVIGFAVGSLTIKTIVLGLSKLPLSGSIQTLILYMGFLAFLAYKANRPRFAYYKKRKLRIQQAQEYKRSIQQGA